MVIRARSLVSLIAMVLCLGACTTGSSAIVDAFRLVRSKGATTESANLRSDVRYLRLTTGGRVVLLVLGYIEPSSEGETEIWYSGTGEVLKLRRGRIVGTTGLATDWRSVRLPSLPSWVSVSTMPQEYRREHDEMPGYRYNIAETIALRATSAPEHTAVIGVAPSDLRWFEERVVAGPQAALALPPAQFAVDVRTDRETTVYAQQCLAADLCLTWQRWPPEKGST